MEVLKESGGLEEKEEGIWPTAPAPWEASFVGTSLDPLMLDPGRERGREGRLEGMEEKMLTHVIIFLIIASDDFDEEELGMMAMLEEVRREGGRSGGREGIRHIYSNLVFLPIVLA